MVALQSHCVREGRALAFRSSALAHRARSIHSSVTLRDEKSSETPDKAATPLRSTIANQAAFNAIRKVASGKDQPQSQQRASGSGLIRFVTIPERNPGGTGRNQGSGSIDGRSLGASFSGSRVAVRRPPPAPGASPRGTRPMGAHGSDIGGTRGPGLPRSPDGTRRARQDTRGISRGKGRPKKSRQSNTEVADFAPEFTFDHYVSGTEVPGRAMPSDSEMVYAAEKAEAQVFGEAYTPQMDEFSLVGSGPGNLSSTGGTGELMHRLLSRTASEHEPTNHSWPSMKAQQLLHGQTVYFHSEEEARAVQDQIKALRYGDLTKHIENLKPEDPLPKRAGRDLSSFGDIQLKTIPEADRAAVNGAWFSGTYVAPGAGAGKNASEVLKGVWRQTARNETYLADDEKSFARKVAALVPARALPAAAKGKPAAPRQRAPA